MSQAAFRKSPSQRVQDMVKLEKQIVKPGSKEG